MKARMPTGRLTRNTARQLNDSVSQPPSVGPMIGPIMMPAPKIAIACPSFSRGLMSSRMACASGTIMAPPTPWITRNSTICSRLVAMPHNTDAAVKLATASSSSILRPRRSDSQPVSGVAMAEATM